MMMVMKKIWLGHRHAIIYIQSRNSRYKRRRTTVIIKTRLVQSLFLLCKAEGKIINFNHFALSPKNFIKRIILTPAYIYAWYVFS